MQATQFGNTIRITYPATLTETYVRSWRERLLSWPWRPWVKIGERETTFSLIQRRMIETERAMKAALESSMYNVLNAPTS